MTKNMEQGRILSRGVETLISDLPYDESLFAQVGITTAG